MMEEKSHVVEIYQITKGYARYYLMKLMELKTNQMYPGELEEPSLAYHKVTSGG